MPLTKALAGLSLEVPDSRPSSARSSAATPMLGKQESFDLSGTNTFSMEDLVIRDVGLNQKQADDGVAPPQYCDLERQGSIGRGAFGRVLLMKHKFTGEQYALKELNAVADQQARRTAGNELRIAQRHASGTQHLVGLLNAFFIDGKICILMEYCDGGSLDDALRNAKSVTGLPLAEVFGQLCLGMRYMHNEMKQVHRDLKPANVLLNSSGSVKLADFGISKQLDATSAMAQTQVGSAAYMAPERLHGDVYSFPSDVWSLGIILLEALLGEHPFPASRYKNFMALYTAISSGETPPPPDGTPGPAREFLGPCLLLEPAKRPRVDALLSSSWLESKRADSRQDVLAWLMKAAARRMADKIIAT